MVSGSTTAKCKKAHHPGGPFSQSTSCTTGGAVIRHPGAIDGTRLHSIVTGRRSIVNRRQPPSLVGGQHAFNRFCTLGKCLATTPRKFRCFRGILSRGNSRESNVAR